MPSSSIQRFQHLSRDCRKLLVEACMALIFVSVGLAVLPFRRAIQLGSVPVARPKTVSVGDCIWAVEAAARRLPWRLVCIHQGLAAQRMLRSAGIGAILHYGARHHPETGKLEAHVWVTVDGRAVIGGPEASDFALVASYPP